MAVHSVGRRHRAPCSRCARDGERRRAIGALFGWSERMIALTIVSVGTGLPEVAASVVSSIRGHSDMAIGNVIGSNMFNIPGVLGASATVAPLRVSPELITSDSCWMLAITVLLALLMFTQRRLS
jgi:cation:H+ antiporter